MEDADFSGYASKAGLRCSDGRTIMPNAFEHQDKMEVPLVWSHQHGGPENVLGKVILENRPDGVFCHGYFNDTQRAQDTKKIVQHGDVTWLSIYANQLREQGKQVFHGMIREVSLVLAGANPGAKIMQVKLAHSADPNDTFELEDEVIITSGEDIVKHGDLAEKTEESDEDLSHADDDDELSDESVKAIYDNFSDKEKDVVLHMIGAAVTAATDADDEEDDSSAQHSDDDPSDEDNPEGNESLEHQEGNDDMSVQHNVFDQNGISGQDNSKALTHSQLADIVTAGRKSGSFKEAVLAHAQEYGITDINMLFPDAKALTETPEWISRRMEWVRVVIDGTRHSPFAKVKTLFADITEPEARAKGYIKGKRKKEEVFKLLKRSTGPTTVYKKQKLDRDDVLDITEMNVIAWLKGEMRLMIEEELARAILVGDGRSSLSDDKVKDPEGAADGDGIRSILHDDELYAIKKELPANVLPKDAVKAIIRASDEYRGSGVPVMFTTRGHLTELLLDEDKFGRPLYADKRALADKLGVRDIIPVDIFSEYDGLFAIIVSLQDYTVGTNKGGELTSFEDFDIDFNQHKYLQETRLSGGLTKPFSAIVIMRQAGTSATPTAPSFDGTTNTITVPTVTGVSYFINDEEVTGDVVIEEETEVTALADDGYYFPTGTTRSWTYTP